MLGKFEIATALLAAAGEIEAEPADAQILTALLDQGFRRISLARHGGQIAVRACRGGFIVRLRVDARTGRLVSHDIAPLSRKPAQDTHRATALPGRRSVAEWISGRTG